MKLLEEYKLTDKITVGELQKWMSQKEATSKMHLIELIRHRFYNRYIKHIEKANSGFLKMGVCCLMIETFQSFKEGIEDTNGKSKTMFLHFFKEEAKFFPGFDTISIDFYKSIRCGILHQAETTNAWRIVRTGRLLSTPQKEINATQFTRALIESMDNYYTGLYNQDFNSKIWVNAYKKLSDIIKNCRVKNDF